MKNIVHIIFTNQLKGVGSSCVTTVLLLTTIFAVAQPESWQQMKSLNDIVTARTGAVGFGIGDKGYVTTGYDSVGNYKQDLWEYDILTQSWSQKANFIGNPRKDATGFSIDGKGYIGTGHNGNNYYDDFWQYDPVTNSWTQKTNFGGGMRSGAISFAITGIVGGSKGYIGTGVDNAGNLKSDLWQYDPVTNSWAKKTDFPGGVRAGAASFSLGTVALVGIGYDDKGNYKNDFWQYSAAIDMWTQRADFAGSARAEATAFSTAILSPDKGYIIGGYAGGSTYFNDFWEFDNVANTWTQKTDFPGGARAAAISFVSQTSSNVYIGTGLGPLQYYGDLFEFNGLSWIQRAGFGGTNSRAFAVGFNIGFKGYMGTGIGDNNSRKKDFWEFDPSDNTWTQLADFGGTARGYAVGLSIGDKGYIGLGSALDNNFKNDFWEYDTATNAWTQKANFGGLGRMGATGFSIGNKGYVGTGTFRTQSLNDFWEYDPATDTWTQKANFSGTARENATGFSIGNKGYLGLGLGSELTDFWEYDALTDSWTAKANFGGGPRYSAIGFSINSKGYVGLGQSAGISFNDFWEFDPDADKWTQKINFEGEARTGATAFAVNQKGYIGLGSAISGLKNDLWEFTPANIAVHITFVTFQASQEQQGIVLSWTATEDYDTKEYQVEKSSDGVHFYIAGRKAAIGDNQTNSYQWIDMQVTDPTNYYRIKVIKTNGDIKISQTLKVSAHITEYITVYPNPVTSGMFTVSISNKKKEYYYARLYNTQGQLLASYYISHMGGVTSQTIYKPSSISRSYYFLSIEKANGEKKTFTLYME